MHLTTHEMPPHIVDNKIVDMWDESRRWTWEEFADLLSKDSLKKIASYEDTPIEGNEDQFVWEGLVNGKFVSRTIFASTQNQF